MSIWAAHQTSDSIDLSGLDINTAESALVFRREFAAVVMPVPAGTVCLVNMLSQSVALGEAADHVGVQYPDFELTEALGLIFYNELVVSIELLSED